MVYTFYNQKFFKVIDIDFKLNPQSTFYCKKIPNKLNK